MADNQKMSIEDILAACRATDGDGDSPSDASASASQPETPKPAEAAKPAAPTASTSKPTGEMSVADIMAAARASDGSEGGSDG